MGALASQITSLTFVYSTVYSRRRSKKHQSSASLAFVWGIHQWPVNSPHKRPVTQKMLPFDYVIMFHGNLLMAAWVTSGLLFFIEICLTNFNFRHRWVIIYSHKPLYTIHRAYCMKYSIQDQCHKCGDGETPYVTNPINILLWFILLWLN